MHCKVCRYSVKRKEVCRKLLKPHPVELDELDETKTDAAELQKISILIEPEVETG